MTYHYRNRHRPESAKYSVLLLGKTQAGKSTFVQFVKNYMDPQHDIDWRKIGSGIKSMTKRHQLQRR